MSYNNYDRNQIQSRLIMINGKQIYNEPKKHIYYKPIFY